MGGIFSVEPEGLMGSNVSPSEPVKAPSALESSAGLTSGIAQTGSNLFDEAARVKAKQVEQELKDARDSEKGTLIANMLGELSSLKQAKEQGTINLSAANMKSETILQKYAASSKGMYAGDVISAFNSVMGSGRIGKQLDQKNEAEKIREAKVKEAADKHYLKNDDRSDPVKIDLAIMRMERDAQLKRDAELMAQDALIKQRRAAAMASGERGSYYRAKAEAEAAKEKAKRGLVKTFAIDAQSVIANLQADMAEFKASGRSEAGKIQLEERWARLESDARVKLGQMGAFSPESKAAFEQMANIFQSYRDALKTSGDIAIAKDKELEAKTNVALKGAKWMKISQASPEAMAQMQAAADYPNILQAQQSAGTAYESIFLNGATPIDEEEFNAMVLDGFAKNASPSKKEYVNPFTDNPRELAVSKGMMLTLNNTLKSTKEAGNTEGYNQAVLRLEHFLESAVAYSSQVQDVSDMKFIVNLLASPEVGEALKSKKLSEKAVSNFANVYARYVEVDGVNKMVEMMDKAKSTPVKDPFATNREGYLIGKNLSPSWDGNNVKFITPNGSTPKEVYENRELQGLSSNLSVMVKSYANLRGVPFEKAFEEIVLRRVMGEDPDAPEEAKK